MIDMRKTVIPKSDQLNADDLIGQTITIKVTKVSLLEAADQPIAINFYSDGGKPYKPCKSMRRVLIHIWGNDGNKFVGRSMTLFRDPNVVFGGLATGGIRISHMSDMTVPVTMALTATRASRKPFTVQPLATQVEAPATAGDPTLRAQGDRAAALGKASFGKFWNGLSREQRVSAGGTTQRDLWVAIAKKADETPPPDEDLELPDDFGDDHDEQRPSSPIDNGNAPVDRKDEAEGAGTPTHDLEGDPAPDPQHDVSPPSHAASGIGDRDGSPRPEGGDRRGNAVATPLPRGERIPGGAPLASGSAVPPTGPQEGAGSPSSPQASPAPTGSTAADEARKTHIVEIKAHGEIEARKGQTALMNFIEGLRERGEADFVSSAIKTAWRELAKAADAAKAVRK